MTYRFGPFALDLATCELRREDEPIALQPRVFGMLRYLIEHRDRVVAKQELIDALWRGQQLNTVAVPWTINRARNALGKTPSGKDYIETVRGHGYRFVGDVQVAEGHASARPEPAPALPASATRSETERPFVGRERVMARMTAALDAAASGQGGLVLLSGEPGIGKTRCLNEFSSLAGRRNVQVWRGRCFEAPVAPAFWPFVQILRAACADPSLQGEARREAERLLREIEPQSQIGLTPTQLLPEGDIRFWLLDSLTRWLCASAKAQVRIVEIDDVHSADQSSLSALVLLRPMLAQARTLLLLTSRDVGAHAERSTATLSAQLRPSLHLALTGLRDEDIHTYLSVLFGAESATRLSAPLAARTGGNPLFLHEVTQILRARFEQLGHVGFEDLRLPHAVRELVSVRFLALDSVTRTLLDAASVIGEDFTLPVLLRATELDTRRAQSALQVALNANIVEAKADDSGYRFTHPVMREVLYADLTSGARANWHAAVGRALEAIGVFDPPLMQLAHHFHHAAMEP